MNCTQNKKDEVFWTEGYVHVIIHTVSQLKYFSCTSSVSSPLSHLCGFHQYV